MTNPKCDCGFEFECRPGHFRNCNLKRTAEETIMICPKCGAERVWDRRHCVGVVIGEMENRFATKREAWEQGYADGGSAVQNDLNLIRHEAAVAERERVLTDVWDDVRRLRSYFDNDEPEVDYIVLTEVQKIIESLRKQERSP